MNRTVLLVLLAASVAGCRSGNVASTLPAGAPAANCDKTADLPPTPTPGKSIRFSMGGNECAVTADDVVVTNGGSIKWTVDNQCASMVTVSIDDKKHGPLAACQKQQLKVAAGRKDVITCTLDPKWAKDKNYCAAYGVDWVYGDQKRKLDPILDIRKGTGP